MVVGVLREQRIFLAVALAYLAIGAAAKLAGMPVRFNLYSDAGLIAWISIANVFLAYRLFAVIRKKERGGPLTRLWRDLTRPEMLRRIALPMPVILLTPSILSVYTSWKVRIPELVPMDWDPHLAAADRWLHGDDAWRLIGAALGSEGGGVLMAGIYIAWFWVFQAALIWQALSAGPAREQYLVSWVLLWGFVGTIGAMMFASVGPVFYGRLHGAPDPFADLYTYVHSLPEWVAWPQDILWDAYASGDLFGFGKGISAMPSLHVAVATLNALVAWRCNRTLGIAAAIYAMLVALASVHLGWHYAIDTYAGAAAAMLIWHFVGLVLRKFPRLASVPAE